MKLLLNAAEGGKKLLKVKKREINNPRRNSVTFGACSLFLFEIRSKM
jgi:hypothetical protein